MNKLLNKFSNSTVLYNRTFSDSKGFYKMNKHREPSRHVYLTLHCARSISSTLATWPHGDIVTCALVAMAEKKKSKKRKLEGTA